MYWSATSNCTPLSSPSKWITFSWTAVFPWLINLTYSEIPPSYKKCSPVVSSSSLSSLKVSAKPLFKNANSLVLTFNVSKSYI